jgi:hypothetical protein
MSVITTIKTGDVIAWGAPGEYEKRGVVRAISRDNATLFVKQTQPRNFVNNGIVRVLSHQARKVRVSSVSSS